MPSRRLASTLTALALVATAAGAVAGCSGGTQDGEPSTTIDQSVTCSAVGGCGGSGSGGSTPTNCPDGWQRTCSGATCSCLPLDGYFSITQLAGAPDASAYDWQCSLDLGPFPFPQQLDGWGCSQTAIYHNRTLDIPGGRIWYCLSSWVPPQDQLPMDYTLVPPPPAGYSGPQLGESATISSQCLGTPKLGYTAIIETLTPDSDGGGNKGCSGMCK